MNNRKNSTYLPAVAVQLGSCLSPSADQRSACLSFPASPDLSLNHSEEGRGQITWLITTATQNDNHPYLHSTNHEAGETARLRNKFISSQKEQPFVSNPQNNLIYVGRKWNYVTTLSGFLLILSNNPLPWDYHHSFLRDLMILLEWPWRSPLGKKSCKPLQPWTCVFTVILPETAWGKVYLAKPSSLLRRRGSRRCS